jgi:hypothetical protein
MIMCTLIVPTAFSNESERYSFDWGVTDCVAQDTADKDSRFKFTLRGRDYYPFWQLSLVKQPPVSEDGGFNLSYGFFGAFKSDIYGVDAPISLGNLKINQDVIVTGASGSALSLRRRGNRLVGFVYSDFGSKKGHFNVTCPLPKLEFEMFKCDGGISIRRDLSDGLSRLVFVNRTSQRVELNLKSESGVGPLQPADYSSIIATKHSNSTDWSLRLHLNNDRTAEGSFLVKVSGESVEQYNLSCKRVSGY